MNILPLFLMTFFVAVGSAIIKIVADRLPRTVALFVQYFFCAIYVFAFWIFSDRSAFSASAFFFIALAMGILNYAGAYCQWAAYRINMARTSLFSPLIGVLTIAFFWIFLREYKHLSVLALVGVVLHLAAIWIFLSGRKRNQAERIEGAAKWFFFTVVMVASFGILNFLMKVLSRDVAITHFLFYWYVGTFTFSALFLSADRGLNAGSLCKQKKAFFLIPLLSLSVLGALAALYWAFQTNSGTLVASYSALNSTFVPVIVGWMFFKEAKGISRREVCGLACGVVAATLIIAFH